MNRFEAIQSGRLFISIENNSPDSMPTPRIPQLQGNPIWFDLATPDPQGAKGFYTGLFGWEWADVPMSGGNTYHMAIRGDANIAGMRAETGEETAKQVWNNHVYVNDAEEITNRIESNGGSVISGPNNADGWGVTAWVATSEGAVFGLWQSLMGYGADIFAEPGAVCWIEYHTHDLDAATSFYSEVFGAVSTRSPFQPTMLPAPTSRSRCFRLTASRCLALSLSFRISRSRRVGRPTSWSKTFTHPLQRPNRLAPIYPRA